MDESEVFDTRKSSIEQEKEKEEREERKEREQDENEQEKGLENVVTTGDLRDLIHVRCKRSFAKPPHCYMYVREGSYFSLQMLIHKDAIPMEEGSKFPSFAKLEGVEYPKHLQCEVNDALHVRISYSSKIYFVAPPRNIPENFHPQMVNMEDFDSNVFKLEWKYLCVSTIPSKKLVICLDSLRLRNTTKNANVITNISIYSRAIHRNVMENGGAWFNSKDDFGGFVSAGGFNIEINGVKVAIRPTCETMSIFGIHPNGVLRKLTTSEYIKVMRHVELSISRMNIRSFNPEEPIG